MVGSDPTAESVHVLHNYKIDGISVTSRIVHTSRVQGLKKTAWVKEIALHGLPC